MWKQQSRGRQLWLFTAVVLPLCPSLAAGMRSIAPLQLLLDACLLSGRAPCGTLPGSCTESSVAIWGGSSSNGCPLARDAGSLPSLVSLTSWAWGSRIRGSAAPGRSTCVVGCEQVGEVTCLRSRQRVVCHGLRRPNHQGNLQPEVPCFHKHQQPIRGARACSEPGFPRLLSDLPFLYCCGVTHHRKQLQFSALLTGNVEYVVVCDWCEVSDVHIY